MVSLGACAAQEADDPQEQELRQAEVLWEELEDYRQWPVVVQDEQQRVHASGVDSEQIHPAPTGAIFVIESPDLEGVAAMQQRDDGLLWARYAEDGEVLDAQVTEAQPGWRYAPSKFITCTGCHGGNGPELGD